MHVSSLAELVGQAWTGIWLYFVLCHRCCPEGIPARYIFFPSPNQTTLKYQKRCLDIETFWLNYRFSMQTLEPDVLKSWIFPL